MAHAIVFLRFLVLPAWIFCAVLATMRLLSLFGRGEAREMSVTSEAGAS